jgi:hypothetical protein
MPLELFLMLPVKRLFLNASIHAAVVGILI